MKIYTNGKNWITDPKSSNNEFVLAALSSTSSFFRFCPIFRMVGKKRKRKKRAPEPDGRLMELCGSRLGQKFDTTDSCISIAQTR
jgi:hypothetical protein